MASYTVIYFMTWQTINNLHGYNCILEESSSLRPSEAEWSIYVSNLTSTGSDNGLSPGRRQTIIWSNAGILLIGHFKLKLQTQNKLKMATILSWPQCVNYECIVHGKKLSMMRWKQYSYYWALLCGESTGHQSIPSTNGLQCKKLMFSLLSFWINCGTNSPVSGDLRCLNVQTQTQTQTKFIQHK